jgi:hypothetical protein
MAYQPNHYNINVQPIFVFEGNEYPFEGLTAEQAADDQRLRGSNMEFRFIVNTLRHYFGDEMDFEVDHHKRGIFTLTQLSNEQMNMIHDIYQDTNEFPIERGRSHLKFKLEAFEYDAPECSLMPDCICFECQ